MLVRAANSARHTSRSELEFAVSEHILLSGLLVPLLGVAVVVGAVEVPLLGVVVVVVEVVGVAAVAECRSSHALCS